MGAHGRKPVREGGVKGLELKAATACRVQATAKESSDYITLDPAL